MKTVSFSAMVDGTQADYQLLQGLEAEHVAGLPARILKALEGLAHSLDGYKIDRLQHSLQTASRAEAEGMDIEWVVAALIHDLGDDLAPMNHSQVAAAIIRLCSGRGDLGDRDARPISTDLFRASSWRRPERAGCLWGTSFLRCLRAVLRGLGPSRL